MTITMPSYVREALQKLDENGFEAYVVGGCVRDFLLGNVPSDWDICTSALPGEILRCFSGQRTIETGRRHGTITVWLSGHAVEMTTFRVDGTYSDKRRPDHVAFTKSLREDLSRRDFTVNAMAYHPKTGLIDFFGGQTDLANGLIRCVGDPDKRFGEDALRILRALRFSSALGFAIEKQTADAVFANAGLLDHIALERIAQEFSGILLGKQAAAVFKSYGAVFAVFLPELLPVMSFSQNNPHCPDIWGHTLRAVANAPRDLTLRLALLFQDIAKPACFAADESGTGRFCGHARAGAELTAQILKRLKYDADTCQAVSSLVAWHTEPLLPGEIQVKRFLRRVGKEAFRQLLAVRRADLGAEPSAGERLAVLDETERALQTVLSEGQCFSIQQLAVNGSDLIALGIPEGPSVGAALGRLLGLVIEGNAQNQREALLSEARRMI